MRRAVRRIKGRPRRVRIYGRGKRAKVRVDPWGGLSKGRKHTDYDSQQLRVGTRVEMEHTNNPYVAKRIAMDHLTERKDYYKRLKAAKL